MGTGGKVCVVCGEDCSDRPRVKDAQGLYACKACAESKGLGAKAAARAPVPLEPVEDLGFADNRPWEPAAGEGAGDGVGEHDLLDLEPFIEPGGEVVPVEGRGCPTCGSAVTPDAVICLGCGANLAGGKALKTKVLKAEKEDDEEPRRGIRIAIGPDAAAWIGGGVFLTLGVLGYTVEPALLYVYVGLWAAFSLGTWIWSIAAAFQDREVGWGVTLIVAPFICFGGLLNFWYVFKESGRDNLKACYVVAIVAGIGGYVFDGFGVFDQRFGSGQWISPGGSRVEAESDRFEPHAEAFRLAVGDQEPADVDFALVTLCDSIIGKRLDDQPDHLERERYQQLLGVGTAASEYPEDVVAEAVRWYESLDMDKRSRLIEDGVVPED